MKHERGTKRQTFKDGDKNIKGSQCHGDKIINIAVKNGIW